MKRVACASQPRLAELGQIDAGQDADRRAESVATPTISEAAEDGVEQPAGAARRRRRLREQRRATARAKPFDEAARQDPQQEDMPNAIARSDMASVDAVDEPAPAVDAGDRRSLTCQVFAPSRLRELQRAAASSSASTMNVIRNRIEAQLDQRRASAGRSAASLNSLASDDAMQLPGANSDALDPVRVADDEGHRHRFAERAAQAEHDAADDADLACTAARCCQTTSHVVAAEAVRRLLQHRRHDLEHVAHHRRR